VSCWILTGEKEYEPVRFVVVAGDDHLAKEGFLCVLKEVGLLGQGPQLVQHGIGADHLQSEFLLSLNNR
jgi:hypothetical protein